MRKVYTLLFLAAILAAGAGAGVLLHRSTTAYTLRFHALPATDDGLAAWLAERPDLHDAAVTREGDAVRVAFTTWGLRKGPDLAAVEAECERLGYAGLHSYNTKIRGGWWLGAK